MRKIKRILHDEVLRDYVKAFGIALIVLPFAYVLLVSATITGQSLTGEYDIIHKTTQR